MSTAQNYGLLKTETMISSLYIDCLNADNLRSFNMSVLRETILGILFCKIDNFVAVNILCSYNDSGIGEWIKKMNTTFPYANNCNITFTTEYPEVAVKSFQGHLRDIGVQYQRSLGCSEVINHDMFNDQSYGAQIETGGLAIFGILLAFICTGVVFVCLLSKACNISSGNGYKVENDVIY